MLTPDKLKEKTFQTTGKGSYRSDDVDSFMTEVSSSYEQMFAQNADLVRKIQILAKKVEEYREDEDSLKMALIDARKLADKIVAEAKENSEAESAKIIAEAREKTANAAADAERVVNEANEKADALLADAKAEAEKIVNDANKEAVEKLGNVNRQITHKTLEFDMLKKEASKFKSELKSMYEKHITLINQLPELAEEMDEDEDTSIYEPVAEEKDDTPVYEAPVEEEEEAPVYEPAAEEEETPVYETISEEEEVETPVYETISDEDEEEGVETEAFINITAETDDSAEEPAFEIVPETDDEDAGFGYEAFDAAEDNADDAQIEIIPADAEEDSSSANGYFNVEEEDDKKGKFKLDLSKIDFSDDEPEEQAEPSISFEKSFAEIEEEPQEEEEDDSSNSFKSFFKKKK